MPYDGDVEWKSVIQSLKDVKYEGVFLVEAVGVFPQFHKQYLEKIVEGFKKMQKPFDHVRTCQ